MRTGILSNYYSWLAYGWTQGKLWLPNVTEYKLDLTFYSGHWYNAFPPLPGVVMLPFVLVWGLDANQVAVSVGLGIVNVLLARLVLNKLSDYYFLSINVRNWLTLLFGFGTVAWQSSVQGTVWYFAQVCALTLLLLSLLVGFSTKNPFFTGLLVGLAGLARPTCWLTLLFWVIFFCKIYSDKLPVESVRNPESRLIRAASFLKKYAPGFIYLIIGPVACLFFMFFYNWLRFGSFSDFGYMNMSVNEWLKADLNRYGQFSFHYFGKNFYYAFLNLPNIQFTQPFIKFDQVGNSIFAITPAFLLVPFALRYLRKPFSKWLSDWASVLTLGAFLSTIAVLFMVLLYYNTGEAQLGYRFIQDCLPFMIILVALAWPTKKMFFNLAGIMVVISVVMNFLGTVWYQLFWPDIFGYFIR
ncbi:MAG TPA: hypothetical protein VH186_24650 [Chloroflexia bacterium]|nr:hypothetical protein [Chloroflexia bacterium]